MTLYGVLVGSIFIFYLVGLFVGKNQFVEAGTSETDLPLSEPSIQEPPVQELEPELEFYRRVTGPEDGQSESGTFQEDSSAAEEISREETAVSAEEPETVSFDAYTVQVGAFTREVDARQTLVRLETKGHSAVVHHSTGEDPYYLVWVGEFKTPQKAAKKNELLRQDGFLTYIKKISVSSPPR